MLEKRPWIFIIKPNWSRWKKRSDRRCGQPAHKINGTKVYVQQRMGEHKSVIVDHILKQGGAIYVAGGAKMARSVKEELS
jgi:sulfite reductase alpha subunit-like flavoprotein